MKNEVPRGKTSAREAVKEELGRISSWLDTEETAEATEEALRERAIAETEIARALREGTTSSIHGHYPGQE